MKLLFLGCLFISLVSCKSEKPLHSNVWVDHMPHVPVKPMPKMIRATSSFGAVMWIENGDTMEINQFDFELVSDTLSIEKAFRSITITPIIKELYIEGRTFMKTTLYADSTFSATTVLRGVSPHYRSIQVQIDTLLKRFRNAAPPKDSTALVFYHQIRLEEF